MDYGSIMNMLQGLYANDPSQAYVGSATAAINNQTKKRVKDLQSKFSTTGMSRSGISGAAENDIYSNAGQNLSEVNAKGEEMNMNNKMNILGMMDKTQELDDQASPWGGLLGKLLSGGAEIGAAALTGGASIPASLGANFAMGGGNNYSNVGTGKFGLNGYMGG